MTDAREIIVGACFDREVAGLQATAIMDRLTSAGFRILGPDEVDPVTLEKAADAAEEQAEWAPLKAGDMRAAILALATKEEGDE